MATPNCDLERDGALPAETRAYCCEIRPGAGHNLLVLAGHIDQEAVPGLHAAALRLASDPIPAAIDWSAAGYVGASALQVLLALGVALGRQSVPVQGDNCEVRRLLELSGLCEYFPVSGSAQ